MGNNSHERFINIGSSYESLRVIFEFFAFGKVVSIYIMTNPLSHKCDNFFVPDQLRGESDSKKFVSRCNQLLIPFCKLVINCSQFLGKCSFFLFIFQMRYINIWMLHLGKNFSCKRFGLKRHDGDLLTWWIKKNTLEI